MYDNNGEKMDTKGEVIKVNGYLQQEVKQYQKAHKELTDKLKTVKHVNEQLRSKLSLNNSCYESENGDVSPGHNGIMDILKEDHRWDKVN